MKLPQKPIDTPFGGFIIKFFENLSMKSQVFMGFTAPKSSFQRKKIIHFFNFTVVVQ